MPPLKSPLLAASLALAPFASAQDGLTATDGPAGGHILSGELDGATSSQGALQAGLKRLRGQFDSAHLLDGVRSKDGQVVIAPFRARKLNAPVAGLIVASYDPDGHSRFAALFDSPKRLRQSLKPMIATLGTLTRERLERSRPAGGGASAPGPDFVAYEAAARHIALYRTAFPDGTATIGVAPGFTPTLMRQATFNGGARDGAYINAFMPGDFLDPNGSIPRMQAQMNGGRMPNIPGQVILPYDTNPVSAWKRRLEMLVAQRGGQDPEVHIQRDTVVSGKRHVVTGTMTLNGEPYVFSGILLALGMPPSAEGHWSISITMLAAPAAHADTDMPALIAMRNSEQVDMEQVKRTVQENIHASQVALAQWSRESHSAAMEGMRRTFESSMRNAQRAQDSIDRSSAGFIHYIQNSDVLEHTPSGAAGSTDAGLASFIAHEDPEHFRVVPMNEYVKGRDF